MVKISLHRLSRGAVVFVGGIILSACPILSFLGDPIGYMITGNVSSSLDHKKIASVRIIASCEKGRFDPAVEGFSDENGEFTFKGHGGYGSWNECQLSFEHPRFKRKVLKLQPARELKEEVPFMRIWRLNVELEPL